MSTYTITAAGVFAASDAVVENAYAAGEAIAAGDYLYYDTTTGQWKKAVAGSTVAVSKVEAMAMNAASAAGQPITVCKRGRVTVAGSLAAARSIMVLSTTAGKMADAADYSVAGPGAFIGIMYDATHIDFNPRFTGA